MPSANNTTITKAQVKAIDDALYRLSLLGPDLDVLDKTGVDTSEYRAYAEHMKSNLIAYKNYAMGVDE